MNVIKNYLYNVAYQVFKIIIPFITIPYLSRILGPKGIGINSYTFTIIQYFVYLSDLGITLYGNRQIAYVKNNKYKLTQNFYEIMIMQICTVCFSYLLFFIFLFFSNKYYVPFYLAQSIMILATAFDISWFFMGVENFKITICRNFIVKLIALFFIFKLVKSYNNLLLYMILYSFSFLIGNLTLFINLRKYISIPNFHDLNILRHFKSAFILFIPQIAGQIYGIFNKNILGILDTTKDVGYFDQADKIDSLVLAVVTATGTVMLPHVSNAFAKGALKLTKKYLYDSFSLVTALSIPIAFGISAISFKFVILFLTSKFIIVAPLIIIESVTIVLIAWSNAIGIQYLLPTQQTKSYTWSIISGASVNIVLDIPLIMKFGVFGSTFAYVASEFSVTLIQLFFIRNQISFKILFRDLYKYIFSGFIMFVVIYVLNVYFVISWGALFIEIIFGILIYIFFIYILKAKSINIIYYIINSKKY